MEAITPQYQQQYPMPKQGTNGLAVASFVLSLLWLGGLGSILAVIFGAIGRRQTNQTGQSGGGLAIAGLIIGIVGVVGMILIIVLVVAAGHSVDTYAQCVNQAQTVAQANLC